MIHDRPRVGTLMRNNFGMAMARGHAGLRVDHAPVRPRRAPSPDGVCWRMAIVAGAANDAVNGHRAWVQHHSDEPSAVANQYSMNGFMARLTSSILGPAGPLQ